MGKDSKENVKQRKKKPASVSKDDWDGDDRNKKTTPSPYKEREQKEEEKPWDVIRTHPAFLVLVFLVIPYSLSILWTQIVLQHPEIANQYLNMQLRPAVGMHDPRQLLIVGSMSSGTSQVTKDLVEHLHIEVGHEISDTTWNYVRDGTVSWFHGIRYLSPERRNLTQICLVAWSLYSADKINFFQPFSTYGIGPDLFGPPAFRLPHVHPHFSVAFLEFCLEDLQKEFGCGLTSSCRTPFHQTLVQTRQPWKIVTSLVAKYCYHGSTGDDHDSDFHLPYKSLVNLFRVMFPFEKWFYSELPQFKTLSARNICTNQMAAYVYRFYSELLKNTEPSLIYPIETTPICHVAEKVGLLDLSTTVYKPNYESANKYCDIFPNTGFGRSANQINKGRVDVVHLMAVADPSLVKGMKELYQSMGYEYIYPDRFG
jgi:hypothetical protein